MMINCYDGQWSAEEGEPIRVELFADWRTLGNPGDYGGVTVRLRIAGRWYAIDQHPFPGFSAFTPSEDRRMPDTLTLFLYEMDTPPEPYLVPVTNWQGEGF
jgi:hypothetical protein